MVSHLLLIRRLKELFEIGDITKHHEGSSNLYIVVDMIEFNKNDIDVEMMQIYPIRETAKYITDSHINIMIHAKANSRDARTLLEFIIQDRHARGWYEVPDYVIAVRNNLSYINSIDTLKKIKKSKLSQSKNVHYKYIDDIDECLDALIDLDALYKLFQDEEYIEQRNIVLERLEILTGK